MDYAWGMKNAIHKRDVINNVKQIVIMYALKLIKRLASVINILNELN